MKLNFFKKAIFIIVLAQIFNANSMEFKKGKIVVKGSSTIFKNSDKFDDSEISLILTSAKTGCWMNMKAYIELIISKNVSSEKPEEIVKEALYWFQFTVMRLIQDSVCYEGSQAINLRSQNLRNAMWSLINKYATCHEVNITHKMLTHSYNQALLNLQELKFLPEPTLDNKMFERYKKKQTTWEASRQAVIKQLIAKS